MSAPEPRDMRIDFINLTSYRNEIEIFSFQPDKASFGKGGGNVISVQLFDEANNPLIWVIGGEKVKLTILCKANADIFSPIVGFYVNDRLGQSIFGDNTFNFTKLTPPIISFGENFETIFEFTMPILPLGDYSITVALAEGSQQEHIQHHWMHEALLLKSHSTSVSTGLVGVPMSSITMSVR